ncbi:MAG: NAD(P)-dependent oxidoreductase [Planctomycetales bacterium]|nr:NAD(P)-dependent oxidoreductase [Planctomycetales bacterium]
MQLRDKTLFISGSTRGIGLAIAKRAARDGANIAIIGKTDEPHPNLPGTVHTAAEEVRAAGGNAIACVTDIRFEDQVQDAVEKTVSEFGGIDVVVNNASAIFLAGTAETPMKKFDLMHSVNVRATFMTTQKCLPYLRKSSNPHVLNISPPLNLDTKWFAGHVAYTMAKYGMSMCVLGMAEEFRSEGIAVNALWPQTAIATAAVQNLLGGDEAMRCCRKPEIMADAAYEVLSSKSTEHTGNFFIDEDLILGSGGNLDDYAVTPDAKLMTDFFVDSKE